MEKIQIPSNIKLSNIAVKQIEAIENNNDLNSLAKELNKCMNFVSTNPTDLLKAQENGMSIEKINENNGQKIISIYLSKTDNFTYNVDENNNVTIINALNHYLKDNLNEVVIYEDELVTDDIENFLKTNSEDNQTDMQMSKTHATEICTVPMSFDMAQNYLAQLIDKSGAFINGSIPVIGRLKKSYGCGKVIGISSFDRKVSTRIDYDPIKGYHFNFVNYYTNEKIAIIINNMTQKMYENYIDAMTTRLNTHYSKAESFSNIDYLDNEIEEQEAQHNHRRVA